MIRFLLLLPLAVLLTAAGCNTTESVTPSASVEVAATGDPILLAVGEAVEVDGHALRFVDVVEDSRCPTNVVCVWEGRAKVQLSASSPEGNEARQVLTLPYSAMTDEEKATWDIGGLTVTLHALLPYPDGESATSTRQVELRIVPAG
ncbi:MAG: hypothetical protein AAGI52_04935 [Bacteroidota bacterium]